MKRYPWQFNQPCFVLTHRPACALILYGLILLTPFDFQKSYGQSNSDQQYASGVSTGAYFRYELNHEIYPDGLSNIVSADLNGDGINDITALSPSKQEVVILLAKGNLHFQPAQYWRLPTKAQSLLTIELTGDLRTDLVVLTSAPEKIQAFQSACSGAKIAFKKLSETNLEAGVEKLLLGYHRTHPEKRLKFFSLTSDGSLGMIQFSSSTGFHPFVPISLSHKVSEIILPDKPLASKEFFSLAVGDNTIWLNRDSTFSSLPIKNKIPIAVAATADLNKNKLPDLVTLHTDIAGKSTVQVRYDIGVETGDAPVTFSTDGMPIDLMLKDMNGNGNLDILLFDGVSLTIHFALQEHTYSEGFTILFADSSTSFAVGDLNGDAKPEIIQSARHSKNLIVYSLTPPTILENILRVATSGNPSVISVGNSQSIWIGCNQKEEIQFLSTAKTLTSKTVSKLRRRIKSIWHRHKVTPQSHSSTGLEEVIVLSDSPTTLSIHNVFNHSDMSLPKSTYSLFSLGIRATAYLENASPAYSIIAILEEEIKGAVPQLLFYGIPLDSTSKIFEINTESPINAQSILSIASTSHFHKPALAFLVRDVSREVSIKLYDLVLKGKNINLVLQQTLHLPNIFFKQDYIHFICTKLDDDEKPDFIIASPSLGMYLNSTQLYQPKQISNFPQCSKSDIIELFDVMGDGNLDLFISNHKKAEVLWMRRNQRGGFHSPKIIMHDVLASSIVNISTGRSVLKHVPRIAVANTKLNTIDLVHLK